MKICINCHAENDNNAKFCHECGDKLPNTEALSRADTSNKKQRNNTSFIVLIALFTCLIFIGAFFLFNTFKTKTPETAASSTATSSTSSTATSSTSSTATRLVQTQMS